MKQSKFYSVFIAVLLFLFTFTSCKNEITPPEEFVPYITAYTGGLVYSNSSVWIELANEQPDVELNAEIKDKLFSFSPSIKGKAYWVNNKTIEFIPEGGILKSGETYNGTFELGKVIKVDKKFRKFNFTFRVEDKNFIIQLNPLDITDRKTASLSGQIRFSDEIDVELLKKAISISTSDKQMLSASVEASEDSKVINFVVENIQRKKEDIELEISVIGKTVGVDRTFTEKIIIPGDIFKMLSAETITKPENGIQITFSNPVSTKQDLRGLISILPVSGLTFHRQDNKINVYFEQRGVSNVTLNIDQGLKSSEGETLDKSYSMQMSIEMLKPKVEILSSGTIIPNSNNLVLPFRAVNLRAVDLKIIRIYENNVLSFLQSNTLKGSNELKRVGRLVYKKTLKLDTEASKNVHNSQNYSIDLAKIMKEQPGAIYRIELSFKQEYSTYVCEDGGGESTTESENLTRISTDNISENEESYWDTPNYYYDYYSNYDWDLYDWEQTDNPCHPTYYMMSERVATTNVMMSDIGLIAKANSENKLWVSVANIVDTKPISGASVTAYNYQLQSIGNVKTDGEGFGTMELKGKPFVLVAEANGQKSYLRMVDGEDNSLSRFDTGGKKIDKGLKGYIYGERGVWRPGDTLHVTFVLYDQEKRIPENHPVTFEIYNPRGQFYSRQVSTKGVGGFYVFTLPTKADDPTGLWNGYVKVGGTSFHKSLRIETIKPNRLKINLSLEGDKIEASKRRIPVTLTSSWLTGATARDLEVKVEMTLSKTRTQFKGYEKYIFNNPATEFSTSESEVYDGYLNGEGEVKFNMEVPRAEDAPGMLSANIVCRVFEPGGDASIYTQNIPFSPFSSYVGLNLNKPENRYIETDTQHTFDIVTLNADGRPVNRDNLEYKIYRIGWNWWWENGGDTMSDYVNNSSYTPVAKGKLKTINGKGSFNFTLKYPDWGRYLVYVVDKESGHATGGTVYIDWPDWRGRSSKSDPSSIKMLSFSTDKTSYEIGEDITVIIPAAAAGNALVALENGSSVLSRTWVQVSEKGDTKYKFKATKEMAPNFYIHISLLQPHSQTTNDLPIRMYGVIPVEISNKESQLEPQIEMPDVLRPETEFTVKVKEKNGKPMTYTLAVVDDGLLDLTNFKTPNPWTEFYAREALGIRTWDMYDYVMGAFAGKYGSMFSVGGDEDMGPANTKANRFKPVVKFIGPFSIGRGGSNTHKIKLPVYVGSVRTMVVAGENGAYGKAEKSTPVRSPLMILSSLPRVISTGEEITLPVNVFAMENSVKNVSVKIETTGLIQLTESDKKSITFTQTGDQMVYFAMKTNGKTGVEKVTITATGGGETSKETIEIDVRNPNPAVISSSNKLLNAGETGEFTYRLSGGTNDDWVKLEVSRIPSVDISRRFDFLHNYQHYCSEQLTSCALPLLYIPMFKDMDNAEADKVKTNVRTAIKNLYGRQLSNGGIVYWPGQSSANDWITSYAGSFLVLAKEKGYEVNEGVLNKWKSYQRKEAQSWTRSTANNYYSRQSEFLQAYRLYSLALAGAAELGAMNRMKEMKDLSLQARWCLAAAYAVNGKVKPAEELIFNAETTIKPYWDSSTYGTSDRDEAMILQTLVLTGKTEEAFTQARKVSKNLSVESYFSTQSTAFALVAMATLAEKMSGNIDYSWTLNGKKQTDVKSTKAIYQLELAKKPTEGQVSLTNNSKGVLYVNLVSKAKPVNDTLPAIANNLRLEVRYADLDGNTVNVSELQQGADFIGVVKVTNTNPSDDYVNLALTHIIPSGWEIFNERMTNLDENAVSVSNVYTYRDIRDDRVLTYFDLRRGQTKEIRVRLQATYIGSFVLPAILCEAMYDTAVQARTKAGRVTVVK